MMSKLVGFNYDPKEKDYVAHEDGIFFAIAGKSKLLIGVRVFGDKRDHFRVFDFNDEKKKQILELLEALE